MAEYTEPADGKKRKPLGELIAVQCHDPAVVELRKIRIRPLGGSKGSTRASPALEKVVEK